MVKANLSKSYLENYDMLMNMKNSYSNGTTLADNDTESNSSYKIKDTGLVQTEPAGCGFERPRDYSKQKPDHDYPTTKKLKRHAPKPKEQKSLDHASGDEVQNNKDTLIKMEEEEAQLNTNNAKKINAQTKSLPPTNLSTQDQNQANHMLLASNSNSIDVRPSIENGNVIPQKPNNPIEVQNLPGLNKNLVGGMPNAGNEAWLEALKGRSAAGNQMQANNMGGIQGGMPNGLAGKQIFYGQNADTNPQTNYGMFGKGSQQWRDMASMANMPSQQAVGNDNQALYMHLLIQNMQNNGQNTLPKSGMNTSYGQNFGQSYPGNQMPSTPFDSQMNVKSEMDRYNSMMGMGNINQMPQSGMNPMPQSGMNPLFGQMNGTEMRNGMNNNNNLMFLSQAMNQKNMDPNSQFQLNNYLNNSSNIYSQGMQMNPHNQSGNNYMNMFQQGPYKGGMGPRHFSQQ